MTAYLTPAQAAEIIDGVLIEGDVRRTCFEALDATGQAAALSLATIMIDRCRFLGRRYDATQTNQWPRTGEQRLLIEPDAAPPTGADGGVPAFVRRACLIQAARIASQRKGVDLTAHVREAAHRGVTSHSGAAGGESIDGVRAVNAWAQLDPEAAQELARHRRIGGEALA